MWLWFFIALWLAVVVNVALFIAIDARNAFDGDPKTPTLSGYIKRWRRIRPWHTVLLGTVIVSLVLIPTYLFAHLVLEVV